MTDHWTPEDRETFARMGRAGATRRRANIRAAVDARFPHLNEEDRAAIADREYRTVLAQQGKAGARMASRKTA